MTNANPRPASWAREAVLPKRSYWHSANCSGVTSQMEELPGRARARRHAITQAPEKSLGRKPPRAIERPRMDHVSVLAVATANLIISFVRMALRAVIPLLAGVLAAVIAGVLFALFLVRHAMVISSRRHPPLG